MLAVEVQNLSHAINNKKILNNINFTLKKDSISCILGPSGSGKTTFLKLIAGLEKAQSGKIIINGEEVSSVKKHLQTTKFWTVKKKFFDFTKDFNTINYRKFHNSYC